MKQRPLVDINLWHISFGKAGNRGEADHDDDEDVDGYEYGSDDTCT